MVLRRFFPGILEDPVLLKRFEKQGEGGRLMRAVDKLIEQLLPVVMEKRIEQGIQAAVELGAEG